MDHEEVQVAALVRIKRKVPFHSPIPSCMKAQIRYVILRYVGILFYDVSAYKNQPLQRIWQEQKWPKDRSLWVAAGGGEGQRERTKAMHFSSFSGHVLPPSNLTAAKRSSGVRRWDACRNCGVGAGP